jgi:hypothetical protein
MDEFGSFAAQIVDSIAHGVLGGSSREKRGRMIEPRISAIA